MSRILSDTDGAYNACIEVINARDEAIERLMEDRDRAWLAAETLAPIGSHGIKGKRLAIGPVATKPRRRRA